MADARSNERIPKAVKHILNILAVIIAVIGLLSMLPALPFIGAGALFLLMAGGLANLAKPKAKQDADPEA